MSIFGAETRKGIPVPEDSLTSKVFGTLNRLGNEVLKAFLDDFLEIDSHLLQDLNLELWPTLPRKRKDGRLTKSRREPDVVITDKRQDLGVVIEAKTELELDPSQLIDEFLICRQRFSNHHMLVVTHRRADSQVVFDVLTGVGASENRVRHITWKDLNVFVRRTREGPCGALDKALLTDLIKMMDKLGYRGVRGLETKRIQRIGGSLDDLRTFLQETEVFFRELVEDVRDTDVISIEGRARKVYRNGTSHDRDSKKWLPSYIIYAFGKEDWEKAETYDLENGSYIYVAFFLDWEDFYVGYWGSPGEVGEQATQIESLGLSEKPYAYVYEKDADWESQAAREAARPLSQHFMDNLAELGEEKPGFDIFYRLPVTDLSEAKIKDTVAVCAEEIRVLNRLIDQLNLRESV